MLDAGVMAITICFAMGVCSMVKNRKYFLSALLSLEFLVVTMFLMQVHVFSYTGFDLYFTLFFLALSACEGALGLAILVAVVRSHGHDNFSAYSTLAC